MKKELFNAVTDSVSSLFDCNDAVSIKLTIEIIQSFDTDKPNLDPFLLVTFADLKKYVYQYWFAFPALVQKPGWEIDVGGLSPVDEEVS